MTAEAQKKDQQTPVITGKRGRMESQTLNREDGLRQLFIRQLGRHIRYLGGGCAIDLFDSTSQRGGLPKYKEGGEGGESSGIGFKTNATA